MAVTWQLYRFDYGRFRQMRPALRAAQSPESFASVSDEPDTDAIVEALVEGRVGTAEAKQALVIALCCLGDPLPCSPSILRLLHARRRDLRAEAGMELLIEALAGAKSLEPWLLPATKLTAILNPTETSAVLDAYRLVGRRNSSSHSGIRRPIKRGGVLPLIATFFRRLFDRGLAAEEVYQLLGELLQEAVAQGQGIAVISA